LSERLFAQAMVAMDEAANDGHADRVAIDLVHEDPLTQQHELIRQAHEYADLFSHAAMLAGAAVSRAMDTAQGGQA
jgi:hypothetical protein